MFKNRVIEFFENIDINNWLIKFKALSLRQKRFLITVCVAVVLVLTVIISVVGIHSKNLKNIEKMVSYYNAFSVNKGEYTLVTDVVKVDKTDYLYFEVEDENENTVLSSLDDELVWCVKDVNSINFRESSYDIIINSDGVGDIVYLYNGNGKWHLQ